MALPTKTTARSWLLVFLLVGVSFLTKPSFASQPVPALVSRDVFDDLSDLLLLGNVSDTESTCKKGVRCKKNACCGGFFGGDEGTCGYGPDFCGDDCDSQCDAKADCGQYAEKPGTYSWSIELLEKLLTHST